MKLLTTNNCSKKQNKLERWVPVIFLLFTFSPTFNPVLANPVSASETVQQKIFGSDSCKKVKIKVNNNVKKNGIGVPITVTRVDFFSKSEGRFIQENIKNTKVPANAQQYKVGKGTESIQYAENDLITLAKIHFKAKIHKKWHKFTVIDNIPDSRCVAGKTYNVTASGNL